MERPNQFMQKAVNQLIAYAMQCIEHDKCDGRDFDDCFEWGHTRAVLVAIEEAVRTRPGFASALLRNKRYMSAHLISLAESAIAAASAAPKVEA